MEVETKTNAINLNQTKGKLNTQIKLYFIFTKHIDLLTWGNGP